MFESQIKLTTRNADYLSSLARIEFITTKNPYIDVFSNLKWPEEVLVINLNFGSIFWNRTKNDLWPPANRKQLEAS